MNPFGYLNPYRLAITDQNMTSYKVNDVVTAKIKYAGDVNIPGGISLYMYNVALK